MENFRDTITMTHVGNAEDNNEGIRIVIRRRGGEKAVLYEGTMKLDEFARVIAGIAECDINTVKIYNK